MTKKWTFADVIAREGDGLARSDLVEDASRALTDAFGDLAPAEALLRAMMSERTETAREARFWVDVYLALDQRRLR